MVETNYRHNGQTLPKCKQRSIDRYVKDGISGGHFLDAVMGNDLIGAFGHADNWSMELMPVIVAYVYNRVPSVCWGSPEIVKAWKGIDEYEKQAERAVA